MSQVQSVQVPTRATVQRQPSKRRRQAGKRSLWRQFVAGLGEGHFQDEDEYVPDREVEPLYRSEIM